MEGGGGGCLNILLAKSLTYTLLFLKRKTGYAQTYMTSNTINTSLQLDNLEKIDGNQLYTLYINYVILAANNNDTGQNSWCTG